MPPQPDPGGITPATEGGPRRMYRSRRGYKWYHKFFAVMLAMVCLIVGVILVILPWMGAWEHNYFAGVTPFLRSWWGNFYLRGAVSGIGLVNLYISLVEVFRLKRFSER